MARKADSHHVLPLFCDDLIASCVDMTPACFGAYMRVLCYAWTRGGIPDDEAACCRITGGMEPGDWAAIRSRLMVLEDGRLSHQRLELERKAVAELKAKKAEAGRKGGRPRADEKQTESKTKANGKQNESKTKADTTENGKQNESKTKAPTPTPTPSPLENTHTAREAESEWRQPGWAATEWAAFAAVWNATERAAKWTLLTAPDGWVDAAAAPGWLDKAREAVKRLPRCRHFGNPLAVTQLLKPGFVDRILAGEFDNAKPTRGQPDDKPAQDPAKRRFWRGDAAKSMTDGEYEAWRRDRRNGGAATALATRLKLTEENA